MKKHLKSLLVFLLMLCLLALAACETVPSDDDEGKEPIEEPKYSSVIYVPNWSFSTQQNLKKYDFSLISHVNYAFSLVSDKSNPIPLLKQSDVSRLAALRAEIDEQGADTKILVSIGGWSGSPYFCEGVATESARENFANECQRWIDEYGLDGIDIDWEYPGEVGGGCTTCSHCVTDFTLVCQLLRDKIGSDKLLTIAAKASASEPKRLEGDKLAEILDFVNLMNYDYGSDNHASFSRTKQVAIAWGEVFSNQKVNIGIPFYARSSSSYDWVSYAQIIGYIQGGRNIEVFTIEDESYAMLDGSKLSFDTPEQIAKKMLFIKENGFGGAMAWEGSQDMENDLMKTMDSCLNGDGSYMSPFLPY